MRKMKKINGYLVVRFNDREKQGYPQIGSFGVIDAELYTGHIDVDLGAFEYDDADTIEVAVEQARGLESEQDFNDDPPFYTVVTETAEEVTEEEVEPALLVNGMTAKLKTQIKSKGYPYIDPATAAHELVGYKTALYDLGLLGEDEAVTDLNHFGELCEFQDDDGHHIKAALPSPEGMALVSPHDYEEGETITGCTVQILRCRRCGHESFAWSRGPSSDDEGLLGYVCDEVCRFREGRTQEELDAICDKCKVERWAPVWMQRPRAEPRPEQMTFRNLGNLSGDLSVRKIYSLGAALGEDCPGNDCIIYRNIFRAAQELDEALDHVKPNSAPALALRSALRERVAELREMYFENFAIQQFKEGMQP